MKTPLITTLRVLLVLVGFSILSVTAMAQDQNTPLVRTQQKVSYDDAAVVLTKYCAGCHNEDDTEGDFSLSSFESLSRGTPDGPVVVSGKPLQSKLLRLIEGTLEPKMPPEDEPQPTDREVELLRSWIAGGLQLASTSESSMTGVNVPKLKPASAADQYVSSAVASGDRLFLGRLGRVEAFEVPSISTDEQGKSTSEQGSAFADSDPLWTFTNLPGKVNSIRVSADGTKIVVGTGIAGVRGTVVVLDLSNGEELYRLDGHHDLVYSAALSPDGQYVASGSYDRKVLIWDIAKRQVARQLAGHNGAIYDLDFDPTGRVLATASADQTVKLWSVETGERLDTLGQPEGEMLSVRFHPDGNSVYAAGVDRQIRKWKLISRDKPGINPMLLARYAHESDILQLQWFGDKLISTSVDQQVKAWTGDELNPLGTITTLGDTPVAVSVPRTENVALIAVDLKGQRQIVSQTTWRELTGVHKAGHGQVAKVQAPANDSEPRKSSDQIVSNELVSNEAGDASDKISIEESEPNDVVAAAMQLSVPCVAVGSLNSGKDSESQDLSTEDVDCFRFTAAEGETWLIEVSAAEKSPVDTLVDVLDASGNPVLRTRLQALRESYFTFRGKDGDTSDDFRLHKWEDMSLDEYLYASGEVNRLWLYPRGPDSGFKVYPGSGKRHTYFGTTAIAHALGEPAFIVRELDADESPVPNGLPVFPIYYRNDDDPLRREGKDSRLEFKAPSTGDFVVRIRDARGFGGESYQYELHIRRPQPDFELQVNASEVQVPRESGREWQVTATRKDGLLGPISVFIENLPEGFLVTNPLIIEAGQESALGTIFATADAKIPVADDAADNEAITPEKSERKSSDAESEPVVPAVELTLIARSEHDGKLIEHNLDHTIRLSLSDLEEVQVRLYPVDSDEELESLSVHRGETITARVAVARNGLESRIGFGKEDSGRNLPHGAYVDNIGLNGLLITEQLSEREFFITADAKLEPGRRQFHLRSDTKGNPTSPPIWLEVLP